MESEIVGQETRYVGECPACGEDGIRCVAGLALVAARLEWSVESECPDCGPVVACGRGAPSSELRGRLLTAHGPTRLVLDEPSASAVVVLQVLRREQGVGLADARRLLDDLRTGRHLGTLAETELLARRLRAAGVAARAV